MTKDYTNYDYLHMTVKRGRLDDVIANYRALLWEDYEMKDDRFYDDVVHISMCRPHKIENKDKLQLMQIYLEKAWNAIGSAESNSHPKTLIFGLTGGIIALVVLLVGIYLLFNVGLAWGIAVTAAGGALVVSCIVFTVIFYRRESKSLEIALERAKKELALVHGYVLGLTGAVAECAAEEAACD